MGYLKYAFLLFCALAITTAPVSYAQDEEAEAAPAAPTGEKFEFQAEVGRLMDIIINSLYSNKDIFLRELISNASDALDKIRFMSLTDMSVLGEGDNAKLDIRVTVDKEKKIVTLRDRGIGMSRSNLIQHLGTIAKSGTSAFLEEIQRGGDMNLIGQFGVGFYSVYLVADYVEVISKHNGDAQYKWTSRADGDFTVAEDTEGEQLGRGTLINIHLKEDCAEYAEEAKIKELIARYSQFINFPIYLYATTTVTKQVPVEDDDEYYEEEEEEESESEEGEDGEEEDGEEDDEEDEPEFKEVTETVSDWELLNGNQAIWLRNADEITESEYNGFYQALIDSDKKAGTDPPMSYTHFSAEGDVEFKSLLFIPGTAPPDYMDQYYQKNAAIKLYVRRVFISDEFEELVPKYLSFLTGIVDSDTLPLNVSREMLQQHTSLKTIKKKLVRKALDMIRKLADDEEESKEEDEEDEGAEAAEEEEKDVDEIAAASEDGPYTKFWKEYGRAIKMGIIEDTSNRTRLAKLLRFYTSKSEDKLTSLEDYISRMKDGQKTIYYIAGESMDEVKRSPFLEKLLKKGFEVIYFTEAVDEYVMQNLTEFDDIKFANASKEDLKLGEDTAGEKKKMQLLKEEFKPLTKWWKKVIGGEELENVKVSQRLSTSPCVVVTSKYGWSANMERIMKAQTMNDEQRNQYLKGKRTLEINPYHPLILDLKLKQAEDTEDVAIKSLATLLYETALLGSGFSVDDTKSMADRVFNLMAESLNLEDLTVEEPPEPEIDFTGEQTDEDESGGDEDFDVEEMLKDEL